MPNTLKDEDWEILLENIGRQRCTPFLGAGACAGLIPLGGEVAREWADSHGYPLSDRDNLSSVAQFVAVTRFPMAPKLTLQERIREFTLPRAPGDDEPHTVMATLPLPVYMTTNYDSLMTEALKRNFRAPVRELCRWNQYLKDLPSAFDDDYMPAVPSPAVFHLHGNDTVPESMVLTEDDYLEFLVALSRDAKMIPGPIRRAMVGSSLLFIGYRMADSTFRVLHRGLIAWTAPNIRQVSFAVQPLPVPDAATDEERDAVRLYLDQYFAKLEIKVYWGTAREFVSDLRQRWGEYRQRNSPA